MVPKTVKILRLFKSYRVRNWTDSFIIFVYLTFWIILQSFQNEILVKKFKLYLNSEFFLISFTFFWCFGLFFSHFSWSGFRISNSELDRILPDFSGLIRSGKKSGNRNKNPFGSLAGPAPGTSFFWCFDLFFLIFFKFTF